MNGRGRLASAIATFALLFAAAAAVVHAVGDGPERGDLLAAWEVMQRQDPQTRVFEKVDDGRYLFATDRFPFDGTLRVLNLVIDDSTLEYGAGAVVGVVEVDLEDVDDDFRRRYAYSIGLWQAGNTLYFNPETASWETAATWQGSMMERYSGGGWWGWVSSASWLVFLGILVIILWWVFRRAGKQINTTMAAQDKALAEQERAIRLTEEALELSRDSNLVLKEIRDLLRDR